MLNNDIDSLQDILSFIRQYDNYETYIEVSPSLYIYLRQQLKDDIIFNKDENPETLFGFKIFLNMELNGFDYNIIRKERDYAE